MADRGTGFHPLDPDFTRGRACAIGEANALARAQMARAARKVSMKPKDESKKERDMGVWPDFEAPPQYDDPAPGWEDPRLPDFRLIWEVARKLGYSIGLHGSMKRDCDLIAAPWTATAGSAEYLVEALCTCLDARVIGGPEDKPHGRRAWSLEVDGWVKTIDLSVMPRV